MREFVLHILERGPHRHFQITFFRAAETRNAANQGSEPNLDRDKSPVEERIARYRDDIRRLGEEKAKLLYQKNPHGETSGRAASSIRT